MYYVTKSPRGSWPQSYIINLSPIGVLLACSIYIYMVTTQFLSNSGTGSTSIGLLRSHQFSAHDRTWNDILDLVDVPDNPTSVWYGRTTLSVSLQQHDDR